MKHSIGQPVNPNFSLIMANYNGEKYIEEAIKSVLNQSFQEWELIIVDDCSTDGSLKIIGKYLDDQRIRLIRHEKNRGYTAALRTGVSHVKAEVFGILDSDDILLDAALSAMYDAHQQYPDCGMIYSQFLFCDEILKPLQRGYCRQIPPDKTNVDCDTVSHFKTFKLSHYNLTEGFTEDIIYAQDKDISYKMEEISKLQYVDKILYCYRMIPTSVSRNANYKGVEYVVHAKLNALKRRTDKNKKEQKEALAHFANGIEYFHKEDFSKAESEISEYKNRIDYESFPKSDNRTFSLPDVSVIIVACNPASLLRDCIHSLLKQTYINFEIIVVDSAENNSVLIDLLSLPVLYLRCPINFFVSEGRNVGVQFANSRIVAFLDDNAIVPGDYIESLMKAFNTNDIGALKGNYRPKTGEEYGKLPDTYDSGDIPVQASFMTEGNSAFLRKSFQELNGFNPLLSEFEVLDIEIRFLLHYGKNSMIYWPKTIIFHDPPDAKKYETQKKRCDIVGKYWGNKYPASVLNSLDWKNIAEDFRRFFREAIDAAKQAESKIPDVSLPNTNIKSILEQVDSFFVHGNFTAALTAVKEALKIAPDDLNLLFAHGNILLQLQDVETAHQQFMKAVMFHPDNALAFVNLATVQFMLGRPQDAEISVQRALEIDPSDIEARNFQAWIHLNNGRYDEALRIYEDVLKQRPDDVSILMVMGNLYWKTGDLQSARNLYNEALRYHPNHADAKKALDILSTRESHPSVN